RGLKGPRTGFVNLESLSDEELEELEKTFEKLRKNNSLSIKKMADEIAQEGDERESKQQR
ncbi:MAG TPA: hypothetical protein PLQ88_29895, partial [Blastocatellia bacterium]|nr:hypothetical protein [Blastocatellia bacterium]